MSDKRLFLVLVLSVALVFTLGVAGCKKAAEEAVEGAIEGATGVDVEADDGSVTIQGEDGSTVEIAGENADLPEDFPDDMPVYDADIESATKVSGGDSGGGFYVGLVTEDSIDDVVSWYRSELEDEGWEILSETTIGEAGAKSAIITMEKGTTQGGVTFAEDGDVTRIAISINQQ